MKTTIVSITREKERQTVRYIDGDRDTEGERGTHSEREKKIGIGNEREGKRYRERKRDRKKDGEREMGEIKEKGNERKGGDSDI